ncbi:hypothetical protein Peur_067830 [Populus x canadensis]
MSAALPDEPAPTLVMLETLPIEIVPEETGNGSWFARKRLKKVHADTPERVYRRTRRPTLTTLHVTNLPRKRVVEWFEDKRAEDSVPEHRRAFQRSVPETVSSS